MKRQFKNYQISYTGMSKFFCGLKHGGINVFLMMFYLFAIISIQIFVNYNGSMMKSTMLLFFFSTLILVIGICPTIFRKLEAFNIAIEEKRLHSKEKVLWVIIFFLVSFGILFCWYLAYCPGAFSPDSINQYGQALTGEYNDHHPVFHTLFAFTLPLKLTGKAEAIVLFQMIEYSCVLAYLAYTILEYINTKWAIFSLLYILLNPMGGRILIHPWKDVSFAGAATLLMIFGLRIHWTEGGWLNKRGRIWALVFTLIAAISFRHNGILFVVPFLLAVLIRIDTRKRLEIIVPFIILSILIKGPIYKALNVEKMEGKKIETLGAPMTTLGNVAKEAPDAFDEETSRFIFSVASKEEWAENYTCGSFSTIRFSGIDINTKVIEETETIKILSMTIRSIFRAPTAALKGFLGLTDVVYSIGGEIDWERNNDPYIVQNDYGIEEKINGKLENILRNYTNILQNSIFKYIFWYVGFANLIIIFSILCKCNFKIKKDWEKIAFCVPVLIYNFATILLISGNNVRLFYLTFPICPMAVALLFGKRIQVKNE